jgi:hypothetical protein
VLAASTALKMEAASTTETSVNFYQTTQRKNSEDSYLHTGHHEDLKSHIIILAQGCNDGYYLSGRILQNLKTVPVSSFCWNIHWSRCVFLKVDEFIFQALNFRTKMLNSEISLIDIIHRFSMR